MMTNLSQDFMDRWYGELKIIKRLDHPNVVRALDEPPGLHYEPMGNNVPFIFMEYCDVGDLRQVGVVRGVVFTMNPWGIMCCSFVWSTVMWETWWVWSGCVYCRGCVVCTMKPYWVCMGGGQTATSMSE